MQLFGIDVPRESKEYPLTVAYVSLNLSDEDEEATEAEELDDIDKLAATAQTSLPAEQVFNNLSHKKRLLIRGTAGSGKTTLLRWAAVQAARVQPVSEKTVSGSSNLVFIDACDEAPQQIQASTLREIPGLSNIDSVQYILTTRSPGASDWQQKIPFIIRLRDCSNGQLPRPNQFPLLLAKELPDPPSGWIDDVLNNGRGLIMFDGVDEVPQHIRDETMREIRALITAYPDNYYVVTTRPEAVEKREFIELGFASALVEPMAPAERDVFIDRWHEAMEVRLRNWNEPTDLRPLAKRLKQRLEAASAVARLTSNPLLCAVVCALHWARNENLPETPVDLCEKLCEMLLDRRDKERLSSEAQKWIDEAYGKLEFRVRKGLLSQLAYYMVNSGVSAITETEADQQIAEALKSYKAENTNPTAIRRALVERSGMLQESSEQGIEFLHNTLKEFLAAERFVNIGNFQILADYADEASWQPVILFAVALPRDGSKFGTELIKAILEATPKVAPTKARAKADRLKAATVRSKQFFFLRCCTNAYQINDSSISQASAQLLKQLVPPQNMTDATVLAACGEAIVPYLKNRKGLKAAERAACVRTLGLIGSPRAIDLLKEYLNDSTLKVVQELIGLVDDLSQITLIKQEVERSGTIPIQLSRRLRDVSALATLTNLTELYLVGTQVRDVSALATLTNLRTLTLEGTQVRDVSALATLTNLTTLDLWGTQVRDVSALATLTNLTTLYLMGTQVSDVSPLATLTNLTELNLGGTQVSDVSPLATLTNLTELHLGGTQVSDVSPLATLTNLTKLHLWGTQVSDVSPLATLTNLTELHIGGTQVSDVSALAALTNLTELYLLGTQVRDVSALATLTNLTKLDLRGTQVSDISALSSLDKLRIVK